VIASLNSPNISIITLTNTKVNA